MVVTSPLWLIHPIPLPQTTTTFTTPFHPFFNKHLNTFFTPLTITTSSCLSTKNFKNSNLSCHCTINDNQNHFNDIEQADSFSSLLKDSSIDVKLPRRSLLLQFTCDACGERTKRMINRLAFERGTVFVQCSGCLQHHKLVDNLGLVKEYDFRNEIDED